MKITVLMGLLFCIAGLATFGTTAFAEEEKTEDAISKCLASWGSHPFGKNPKYKTLATSVKVFGIGGSTKDAEKTESPALVLVNPAVNVMGRTTYELLNPNGWYCFRANVNVMGGFVIRAHCKAHIASSSSGATVLGSDETDAKDGVTVMGSTKVERFGCAD